MNDEMRMDLFDRKQNQRMLKAAVELAEARNYYGFEMQWLGFGASEKQRLDTKRRVMGKWTRDENYMTRSAELQAQETALLERLRIVCEQNAEIVIR